MKTWATIALLCMFSGTALADHTIECTMKGKTRTIEVSTESGKGCDVLYTKEGEKNPTALWTYQHSVDQCPIKAKAFAEKLTGFGYTCTAKADAPAAAAAAPAAAPAKK